MGSEVSCEKLDQDRYGRVVGRCFSNDNNLGETMVVQGLALAYRQYSSEYVPMEGISKSVQRGMWVYPAGSGPAVADALLFAPPMVVTDDHIDRIVDITVDALNSFG